MVAKKRPLSKHAQIFGMERSLDTQLRLKVPAEFARALGWTGNTPIVVYLTEDGIAITLPRKTCVICHDPVEDPIRVQDRDLCRNCAESVAESLLVSHGR